MTALTPLQPRPQLELADILHAYLPEYLKSYSLSPHHHKVLRAILNCRTAALNAHTARCNECDHLEIAYNSCRNRHCPKCQGSMKLNWLGRRQEELLPVPYYHCVFTLPHVLNWVMMFNQEILYQLFFHKAFETLNAFAANPKRLGAQIGFVAILHTWGQDLKYHVHLHFIVTGGGISSECTKWIAPKYEQDFLFPVRAMSKVFRGKFIEELEGFINAEELHLPGALGVLRHPVFFEDYKRRLHDSEWVVYAKKPFAGPEQVLEYIGRYTHRVAISNHRLKSMTDGEIIFEYKDYKDENKTKLKKLPAKEFITRYLRHIVPFRFVRLRYGGFFAGGERKTRLARAHALVVEKKKNVPGVLERFLAAACRLFEEARRKCPKCAKGTLVFEELVAVDSCLQIVAILPGPRGHPGPGAVHCR